MSLSTTNIFITSRNRISGTPSNFSVNLQPLITRVKSWYLKSVTCDFSYYVINSTNNTFVFSEFPGVPITVTLANGSPSAAQLCADIASKMTASAGAGVYTCVFDNTTQKFTISSTVVFTIEPNSGNNVQTLFTLGFLDPNTGDEVTKPFALTYTGNSVAHVSGSSTIYLYSSFLNLNSIGNTDTTNQGMKRSNAMAAIPVTVNFGGVIQYLEPYPVEYNYRYDNFSNIDFQLRDSLGNLIDLNGGELNIQMIVNTLDS